MVMAPLRVGKPGKHAGQFTKAVVLLDEPHPGAGAFTFHHDMAHRRRPPPGAGG